MRKKYIASGILLAAPERQPGPVMRCNLKIEGTTVTLRKVLFNRDDGKYMVSVADQLIGEVWREQTLVVVSKLTEPERTSMRWRWFAKWLDGDNAGKVLTQGARRAMLMGAGFATRQEALRELISGTNVKSDMEQAAVAAPDGQL